MASGNNVFAFQSCDNNELKCINSDTPFERKIINHENSGIETKCPNLVQKTLIKIYAMSTIVNTILTIDKLQSSKDMGNFNIFHNNLNGLENKFDVLHNFLTGAPKN